MSGKTVTNNLFTTEGAKQWFDEIVAEIRTHQVTLETNTAPEERERFYKSLYGDGIEASILNLQASSMLIIKAALLEYLKDLKERNAKPQKLALDISNKTILVWAQVPSDDMAEEAKLLLAEAKVNAEYYERTGIHIDSTIVDELEELSVPNQYKEIELNIK